jgi:hypothetical protein
MGLFEGNAPPYAAPYAALYAGNLAEPYSPMDKLPKQDVGRVRTGRIFSLVFTGFGLNCPSA